MNHTRNARVVLKHYNAAPFPSKRPWLSIRELDRTVQIESVVYDVDLRANNTVSSFACVYVGNTLATPVSCNSSNVFEMTM